MIPALEIKNLTKQYPNGTKALNGIDLTIQQGDFFALLGANGAGKTTAIHIICGLLIKTAGHVRMFGLEQDKHPNRIKKMIGLMGQEFNFNQFEPVEEILINQAGYYGITKRVATKRAHKLLEQMELFDKRKQMAQELSGGMKRRLMLARSLIHEPKMLILDEPTAGVDIEIRLSLWDYLVKLNRTNVTIILTTHYLEEAERLCHNIAIINKGKVIEQTTKKDLLSKLASQVLIFESANPLPKILYDFPFKHDRMDDFSLRVTLTGTHNISDVISALNEQHIAISHVQSAQNRLESLYLDLTK